MKKFLNVNVNFSFRTWVSSGAEMKKRKKCPVCKRALDDLDKGRFVDADKNKGRGGGGGTGFEGAQAIRV